MRTLRTYFFLGLIAGMACTAVSCKKRDIKGEQITISKVSLAMKSDQGRVLVPTDSNYSKTVDYITIPLEITFSDAVPRRFNVNVAVDDDTINSLIANHKLPDAVLLPAEFYSLPSNVDVRFGLDHIDFNLKVDVTAIERNYGKNLALAVALKDPTKDNTLSGGKQEIIVVINTSEVISSDEIHYIYFTGANSLLNIPEPGVSYNQGATYLTVPVKISLGGVAGGSFNVRLAADPDTVQKLINAGELMNTTPLNIDDDYIIPDSMDFAAHKNEDAFNMLVKVDVLKQNLGKKVALALTLKDPDSHLLDTTRKTVVIVMDPVELVESDITNEGSTLSVQRENVRTGEVSPNVIDNDKGTKYLLFDFTTVWIQLQYPQPMQAGAYTLTSANDAPGRDPKDWQLLGSNDGSNWSVLDSRSNELFSARGQTKKYTFSNKISYSYYRLLITKNNGDGLFQMAEWRLIRRP